MVIRFISIGMLVLLVSCPSPYLKQSIKCEAGRHKQDPDCWIYGELGSTIDLEKVFEDVPKE